MRKQEDDHLHPLNRRSFLWGGTLFLAGSALLSGQSLLAAIEEKPKLRLGLVTDLHHADKEASDSRYYRETLTKFAEVAKRFDQEKPDIIICLGDSIDSAASLETEKGYLRRITKELSRLPGQHHFVLGNHCVENLTKPEFLGIVGQERSYYSFDAAGYHFVILDACFTSDEKPYGRKNFKWADAKITSAELEWLQADIHQSSHKSIVCIHQCLDLIPPFGVKNGHEVRKVLQESGKVLTVLQGHYHWGNYQEVGGLHYCTMSAVVEGSGPENNSYAMLDILPGDAIRITGFRKQKSYG
ncbi:MAG: metallophosphoesterase [Thermoguttaceae bacterium]|jgi:alkaline phosphatase